MITGQRRLDNQERVDLILDKIGEYAIYRYYLGEFELGIAFCNPLRNDTSPSMTVIERNDSLAHMDYGDGRYQGRCIDLVMQKHWCDFPTALSWIERDFGLNDSSIPDRGKAPVMDQPMRQRRPPPKIHVVTRNFNLDELRWWGDRLQGIYELKRENVYAPKEIYRNYRRSFVGDGLVFCYYYPDVDRWKIYRPYGTKDRNKETPASKWKWDGNLGFQYAENLEGIEGAKRALLCGKKKDRMYLSALLQTNTICNVQAEDPSCLSNETLLAWRSVAEPWGNGDDDTKGHQFTEFLGGLGFKTLQGDFVDIAMERGHEYVLQHFKNQGFI